MRVWDVLGLGLPVALAACKGAAAPEADEAAPAATASPKTGAAEEVEAAAPNPAPTSATAPAASGSGDYAQAAVHCPPQPEWLTIDPPQAKVLPGDEVAFAVEVAGGVGRLTTTNPWVHFDPDAKPAARAEATVVGNEHTVVHRATKLEAERGGEASKVACAQPEMVIDAAKLEGLSAEQRRDVTDIAFHGAAVSIAGQALSFSFTRGLEESDCGHHVVPVSAHWVREDPETARLYIAVEDRTGGAECTGDPVTPRVLAQAPIPEGTRNVHVIFDLVASGRAGPQPYVRHEKTIPVADDTHTLSAK